tara:strand:- start:343 stop:513 length:171 start_codon:yes stop_codon:yes gene_type:complete
MVQVSFHDECSGKPTDNERRGAVTVFDFNVWGKQAGDGAGRNISIFSIQFRHRDHK